MKIKNYMSDFPFEYFLIINDVKELGEILAMTLMQFIQQKWYSNLFKFSIYHHSIGSYVYFLSKNRFSQINFLRFDGFTFASWNTNYPSLRTFPSFFILN